MKVGIVLGAGGPVGWAYHLGVLEGVRSAIGREPGQANRLVGTSAGGAVAASLLAGSSTDDVLRSITTPLTPEQREEMGAAFRRTRSPLRLLRPQAPRLIGRGGLIGLVGLLPAGVFPTAPLRRFPTAGLDTWPERLWMPAVRLDDGELVVFGRDRTDIEVADALEATSAVPGMFQPKRIGDERFLDGAVASATHADLLAPVGLDHVLISSPMTRPGRGVIRWRARRQLAAEVEALERSGASTVVLSPDEAIMEVADGYPRSAPDAGPAIVEAAKAQTEAALRSLT